MLKISLLHATFHRENGVSEVVDAWMGLAGEPSRVEYVVAGDDDDMQLRGLKESVRLRVLINPKLFGSSSAVRNWNWAADVSTGDLLVVIADDLFPPRDWDFQLASICDGLNPIEESFAIKIADNPRLDDRLMRHPVISRHFYTEFGLFDSRFEGVYCDRDITIRASRKAFILDGRTLKFEHRHPTLDNSIPQSRSHSLQNSASAYQHGQETLNAIWKPSQLRVGPVLLSPTALQGRNALTRRVVITTGRLKAYLVSNANYLVRRVMPRAVLRRLRNTRYLVLRK